MDPLAVLEAAFTYDAGTTDSGYRDDEGVSNALEALARLGTDGMREAVAKWSRDKFLSDEAIAQGYGLEDAAEFEQWLREQFQREYRSA